MEKIIYRLPIYWSCPLINDDYSGVDDKEEEQIRNFLKTAQGRPIDVDFSTEGFYSRNDAGTLPGDCADFLFVID